MLPFKIFPPSQAQFLCVFYFNGNWKYVLVCLYIGHKEFLCLICIILSNKLTVL